MRPKVNSQEFDPEATYLMAGGLGGLGRSMSLWMAERGAKHLTFLSRSGDANPWANTIIQDLAALGATTEIVKCDILQLDSVESVIKQISKQRSIKGLVHFAMVRDVSISIHKPLHEALNYLIKFSRSKH